MTHPSAQLTATVHTTKTRTTETPSDWRQALPVLDGALVSLRELVTSDAPSLKASLATDDVARLISAPPPTIEGFERFIAAMRDAREGDGGCCFAVVPHGQSSAIGIFQVRPLEPGFRTAEWGFAIGSAYWGTGVFLDGAHLVLRFIFEVLGVRRLEARAALLNGRGNGALRKLGAVQELILRRAFLCNGQYVDQALWSILEGDWTAEAAAKPAVHVH